MPRRELCVLSGISLKMADKGPRRKNLIQHIVDLVVVFWYTSYHGWTNQVIEEKGAVDQERKPDNLKPLERLPA
jgi:hypothetical protein